MQKRNWRVIDTGIDNGFNNMAVDEALMREFQCDCSFPVFRVYSWNPPALSIGRFQDVETVVNRNACANSGVRMVRRMTGGGAIFHENELTYSIVCSASAIEEKGGVRAYYRFLTRFLLTFYRRLGLDACYASDVMDINGASRSEICSAGYEAEDILVENRKLGGNAQRLLRGKQVIFQHGSIPITFYPNRVNSLMMKPVNDLASKACGLSDLGVNKTMAELKELLVESFGECADTDISMSELMLGERRLADSLVLSKYDTDSWNLKGQSSEDNGTLE